jgi:hypothetical protein
MRSKRENDVVVDIDLSQCAMFLRYGHPKGRLYGSVLPHVSRAGRELRR